MLPGGFKKDSRIWLHKNAHVYEKKALTKDSYNVQLSDDIYDNTSEDHHFQNQSPYITDEHGQVFKKDGRTWLHKSSLKKLSKTVTNGVLRMSSTAGKTGSKKRQFRGHTHLIGGELIGTDLIGTRSSTEMIRKQNVVLKIKKSTIPSREGGIGQILDSVNEMTTNAQLKKPGASYHNMKTSKAGSCEVSAYASDFCIVGKKKSSVITTFNSSSSDDDNTNDLGHRSNTFSQYEMDSESPVPCQDFGGISYHSSNVEVTRDGLQQLERMLKEQSRHRSERLTLRRTDDSIYGLQHEVSPDTMSSESKISLDACINLSEELGNENLQVQNSVDPLSQSFEFLQIRSTKGLTSPDNTCPAGDS